MTRRLMFAIVLLLTVQTSVHAHGGATGIVKERMDAMSEMGDRSKALNAMVRGRTAEDADVVRRAASLYVSEAARMLDWFPDTDASRAASVTDALPAIWENWPKFVEEAADFQSRAEHFAQSLETAADSSEWQDAFRAVGRSCRSCHKAFRKKKQ